MHSKAPATVTVGVELSRITHQVFSLSPSMSAGGDLELTHMRAAAQAGGEDRGHADGAGTPAGRRSRGAGLSTWYVTSQSTFPNSIFLSLSQAQSTVPQTIHDPS